LVRRGSVSRIEVDIQYGRVCPREEGGEEELITYKAPG
jgi:hypothetical protein